MYRILIVLILFAFVSCSDKDAETAKENVGKSVISEKEFMDMVNNYYEKIDDGFEPDTNDCIVLVKMHNTMAYHKLWHTDTVCKNFNLIYLKNLRKITREMLEAEKDENGAWYSKKFNIYIGKPEDKNSRYDINDLKPIKKETLNK